MARMRVRRAVRIPSDDVDADSCAESDRVVCAIGDVGEGDARKNFVWIRGGPAREPAHLHTDSSSGASWIDVDVTSLCGQPTSLSDDKTLLADTMAAVIRAAKIVESRQLQKLAVLTTGKTAHAADLFVKFLRTIYDQLEKSYPTTTVVFMDQIPVDMAAKWTSTTTLHHEDLDSSASLQLDGCIDFCCTTSSVELATSQLEPLGSLLLLKPVAQDAVAINTNSVVVNELTLVYIGDYRGELSFALGFLADHS